MCVCSFFFLKFLGNLAPCVAITNLRDNEWRNLIEKKPRLFYDDHAVLKLCEYISFFFTHLIEILLIRRISFRYVHIVILFYEIKQLKKKIEQKNHILVMTMANKLQRFLNLRYWSTGGET